MVKNKIIVVNAVASIHSGALFVLKNFILCAIHSEFNFFVFTGIPLEIEFPKGCNVRVFVRPNKTGFKRFFWDHYQLKRELKVLYCKPDLVFSLQNTDFKVSNKVPHVVFFHNPFMLYDRKWSFFNRNERLFWFYKEVYRYIVRYSLNRQSVIIVQSQWAKEALKKRGFVNSTIKVFKETRISKTQKINTLNTSQTIQLFYPATPFLYKNHKFLFDLLAYIKAIDEALFFRIKLNLTICFEDIMKLNLIKNYQIIKEAVVLHGYISKISVDEIYRNTDFLIYPSEVETLGLPLLEASEFGIKILAINLDYSREVLSDYKNAVYLDCKDFQKWVEQIKHFAPSDPFENVKNKSDDFTSWDAIFKFFNELMNNI